MKQVIPQRQEFYSRRNKEEKPKGVAVTRIEKIAETKDGHAK